jgi:hypothetical protein
MTPTARPARRAATRAGALLATWLRRAAATVPQARPMTRPEIALTGPQARAIAVAWAEFAKTGGVPAQYEVIVATHADTFEVIFVPEHPPGSSLRGGETPAGKELHYWLSCQDFGLQKTTFGR